MASGEMVGRSSVLRRRDAPGAGRSGEEVRGAEQGEAGQMVRIKGGPSQYPEEAAALAFFRVPRIKVVRSWCTWGET